jgi:hypothetical protein
MTRRALVLPVAEFLAVTLACVALTAAAVAAGML